MVNVLSGLTLDETADAHQFASQEGIAVDYAEGLWLLWKRPATQAFVLCKAFSIPDEILAEVFPQVSMKEVTTLCGQHPAAKDLYQKWSLRLKQLDGQGAHSRLKPMALLVQESIMSNSQMKPETRLRVAEDVIDRVDGKPKQTIQTASLNLNVNASIDKNTERLGVIHERLDALQEQRRTLLAAKQVKEVTGE